MAGTVRRLFVRKKRELDTASGRLLEELRSSLCLVALEDLVIYHRYDIEGLPDDIYPTARDSIFSEVNQDAIFEETLPESGGASFAVEYLPGQYDQRADSATQCVQLLTHGVIPRIRVALHYQLQGTLSAAELAAIKKYCINPVDSREAAPGKPASLEESYPRPADIPVLTGFTGMDAAALAALHAELGLAMGREDLEFCRGYFAGIGREPTLTEIRVLDTYWSDHCRHTTFMTELEEVTFAAGPLADVVRRARDEYLETRQRVYGTQERPVTLMDIATLGMKALRREGRLGDLDDSEEINACSIRVPVRLADREEEWLLMFKNETHNHPTEIEPFGGAATCLGGAIRDPLSGRAWVYQAMRVTGSGDPTVPVAETLPGKLPQQKITREAAHGYSSYGNQIGLATGQVAELYHPGFVAKRMEIGAVIAAAPAANVVRQAPVAGDVVILTGGRTGRDGCGGATGSSKAHDETSLLSCGAEVQKGNPVTERKLQRLFRNPEVSRRIKRCNDFGAGGVSVAIGELAAALDINLDAVPLKYNGLDGTELAISESQERMAVVVAPEDAAFFLEAAAAENLEATRVAEVTGSGRLRMLWRGGVIVDLERSFLDTNGVGRRARVHVAAPDPAALPFAPVPGDPAGVLGALNGCSKQGLAEQFDATIGAATVLHPFGGDRQLTPVDGMVALLPAEDNAGTASLMTYGYQPGIAAWSPFHGGFVAVLESVAKAVALGADHTRLRLTLQEYFERLGDDPARWGKPCAALLGAFVAQRRFGIAAIGGKDSMSGSFGELAVPPTLVSFAVGTVDAEEVVSPEFKRADSTVVQLRARPGADQLPDTGLLERAYRTVRALAKEGTLLSARAVAWGGVFRSVAEQCFGNWLGFRFAAGFPAEDMTRLEPGSLILELAGTPEALLSGLEWRELGRTIAEPRLEGQGLSLSLDEALRRWQAPLGRVFPEKGPVLPGAVTAVPSRPPTRKTHSLQLARPRVFIPVFPGTNCEYDTARVFAAAGAVPETAIFHNLSAADVDASVEHFARTIAASQILVLPGGFSAGDEPDGSGKFITAVFRNPRIAAAVQELLDKRHGLILGICNGFQALIKLGLVPFGRIMPPDAAAPTLTFNTIGRHISRQVRTVVASTLSPWLAACRSGEIHTIPVSHGEGRFLASAEVLENLAAAGQIATRYVDREGVPTMDPEHNPNGSYWAVEGITSPDGRVFGKMAHSERCGPHIGKNIPGNKDQGLFRSGVAWFS